MPVRIACLIIGRYVREMKITNSFTVDVPIDEAWVLLTDLEGIAPCLPGAKLTGVEDEVYSGGIKIKVGPVTSEYKGSAEFVERDEVHYKCVINGKGRDTRGAGNAQALITAQMVAEGAEKTRIDIVTDLKVSGKVAQFGRGVMQDVSTKLLGHRRLSREEDRRNERTRVGRACDGGIWRRCYCCCRRGRSSTPARITQRLQQRG